MDWENCALAVLCQSFQGNIMLCPVGAAQSVFQVSSKHPLESLQTLLETVRSEYLHFTDDQNPSELPQRDLIW